MIRAMFALLLAAAAAARADSACIDDAVRYCPDVQIGEGRVQVCLRAHWPDLRGSCQQELNQIENKAREVNLACQNDVWTFCANTLPGRDRVRVCLQSNWNRLSSTCRDKVAEVSEKKEKIRANCAGDVERLCPGIEEGRGQIYLCLKAQESKTSPGCRAALR